MIRPTILAAAALLSAATAQTGRADPLPTESHKVLTAALAIEAAQTALAACKAKGFNVSIAIVDRTGLLKILVAGDGASLVSREAARRRAYTSAQWRLSTADFAKRFPTPAGFTPLTYDPQLTSGPGGLPIKVGNDVIAGIASSGAPTGDIDETCAAAGLAKIADRLN